MASDATYPTRPAVAPEHARDRAYAAAEPALMSRTSWGAIFIGAVLAAALMILFDLLGLGLGLFALDVDTAGGAGFSGFSIGAVIWLALTTIVATAVGGYVAGRSSGALTGMTAGIHGAAMWGVSTLIVAVGTWMTAGALASGTFSAVRSAAQSAGDAAAAVLPEDVSVPDLDAFDIAPESLPPPVREALRERDLTVEDIRREARAIARDVISRQEQRRATQALTSDAAEIAASPGSAGRILEETVNELVGRGGVLSEEDLEQIRTRLSQELGISPQEVEQVLQGWSEAIRQAVEQAQAALTEARAAALETAETAVNRVATASLVAAVVSALGLVAGVGGAMSGRPRPSV